MPMIEASLFIPADMGAVWQVVSDPSRAPAWLPDIKERWLISSPPIGVGSQWEDHGLLRGRPFRMVCRVTHWQAPRHLAYQHVSAEQAGAQWHEHVVLEPQNAGTLVTLRLEYRLLGGWMGRLYDRLFFQRDFRITLENRLEALRDLFAPGGHAEAG